MAREAEEDSAEVRRPLYPTTQNLSAMISLSPGVSRLGKVGVPVEFSYGFSADPKYPERENN